MNLKEIRLVRDATVVVKGVAHELRAGWQKVEQEVADHWMVKALTDNNDNSNNVDTRDAQILELSGQLGAMKEQLANAESVALNAHATTSKLADVEIQLGAVTSDRDNAISAKNQLTEKVAALQQELDASRADLEAARAADSGGKAKHK